LLEHVEQLIAAGTSVMIATHHREEWPRGATHELELQKGRTVYGGPIRSPESRTGTS
jgi:ABC-type molybdenum transport system ATPase subunit/photorepair protein PhrA